MNTVGEVETGAKLIDPDLEMVGQFMQDLKTSVASNRQDVADLFVKLISLYEIPKVPVRFKIVHELSSIDRPESVDLLKRALAQDESPLVKHEAASSLGQIGDISSMPDLVRAMEDNDWIVRHEAAMALDTIGDETVLPVLSKHLADPDPAVAASCEVAISSISMRRQQ